MSAQFDRLMEFCRRINPSSLTSRDEDRKYSVTVEGLMLVPKPERFSGQRVLILGCGDGYEVTYARETLGWDAVGLTCLMEEVDRHATSCDHRHLVVGDMHALPFADHSFAAVYSKETLEHSPCPFLALTELNRVTMPGGHAFHVIPDSWQKQRDWYHFSCLPPYVWCDLFRKAGFSVSSVSQEPDVERCVMHTTLYVARKDRHFDMNATMEDHRAALDQGGV